MTPAGDELPHNLESCHALIGQLRSELQAATNQIASLLSAAGEEQDAAARICELEALVCEQQETIADQRQTIENLAADNAILKRSLFGSRRERFTDPAQTFLFDPTTLESPQPEEEKPQSPPAKKRTSQGRQRRVFPEFLPREERSCT